jgi:hypothetical protein
MLGSLRWSRVAGSLALAMAMALAGCDAPMAPTPAAPLPADATRALAKKLGLEPSVVPQCDDTWPDGRALCYAEVNTKHGNATGLPVNLTGVRNGTSNGAELTVSVLGTLDFNLSAVYLNTLRLGDVETLPPETPVTLLKNGKYQASIVDLNGDGILDLLLHFNLTTMVAKGDISETTTKLCLYGEGPGYVLNGCGMGGGGEPPPPPPPPPDYTTLPNCDFDLKTRNGYRCAIIQLFGKDGNVLANVLQVPYWLTDSNDPQYGYPGWTTISASLLTGMSTQNGRVWTVADMPFGRDWSMPDYSPGNFLQGTCGLNVSEYNWARKEQLLVRTDLTIPAEARNVWVEFIVDDKARVYLNGNDLFLGSRDFPDGWATSGANGSCVNYGQTVRLLINPAFLTLGGINKLGVWASDSGGYVNYLDVRVFAEVPIS